MRLLYWPNRNARKELRTRDGFLIAALFWTVLGLFGALPLMLDGAQALSPTDAVFESFSGLTTTGATVITGIDFLPEGILYYRQQLQWLGGMGIVVLAVAILPTLGIGGMQLYRTEIPGPLKGLQADAEDHRDRQGAVVYLCHPDHHLLCRLLACRHELVRCPGPQLLHGGDRWLLDL